MKLEKENGKYKLSVKFNDFTLYLLEGDEKCVFYTSSDKDNDYYCNVYDSEWKDELDKWCQKVHKELGLIELSRFLSLVTQFICPIKQL